MTWVRIWLRELDSERIGRQRDAITRLLNAGVLSHPLRDQLHEVAHVLAAVDDGVRSTASAPPGSATNSSKGRDA